MVKTVMKRIALPRTWAVPRKSLERESRTFISRPNPGKSYLLSVAINTFLKELTPTAHTRKEVKHILKTRTVLVNGTRVKDEKFPVGLFDVVSLVEDDQNYRLTLNIKGKMVAEETKDVTVPRRVVNKSVLSKGRQQLNLFNGSNCIAADKVAVGDSVVLKDGKVSKTYPLVAGANIMLVGGKHIGKIGTVKEFKDASIFVDVDGVTLETSKKYAYVLGDAKEHIVVRSK
ncbi:MAG: hypothetical protein ACMXYK_00080 [Candidatus Woesearchaeota archaeon]